MNCNKIFTFSSDEAEKRGLTKVPAFLIACLIMAIITMSIMIIINFLMFLNKDILSVYSYKITMIYLIIGMLFLVIPILGIFILRRYSISGVTAYVIGEDNNLYRIMKIGRGPIIFIGASAAGHIIDKINNSDYAQPIAHVTTGAYAIFEYFQNVKEMKSHNNIKRIMELHTKSPSNVLIEKMYDFSIIKDTSKHIKVKCLILNVSKSKVRQKKIKILKVYDDFEALKEFLVKESGVSL